MDVSGRRPGNTSSGEHRECTGAFCLKKSGGTMISRRCLWSQGGHLAVRSEAFLRPGGASGEELTCKCRRHKRCRFDPWVGKISWRRTWQPTPVFMPGKSHGQRSLVGYSPWGRKESDTTERPSLRHSAAFNNGSVHSHCYVVLTVIHLPSFSPSQTEALSALNTNYHSPSLPRHPFVLASTGVLSDYESD